MPFAKGTSGNPAGKPKGANRTQKMRAALLADAPDILAVVVAQARAGDMTAARLILDRTLPPLKPESRAVPLPMAENPATQAGLIVAAAIAGTVPNEQATDLLNLLLNRAKLAEALELMQRIEELEQRLEEIQARKQP